MLGWLKIRQIIASRQGWSEECVDNGHDIIKIDGKDKNIAHQKGNSRQTVEYYSGTLSKCKRKGCAWEFYSGPKTPFLTETDGENVQSKT